MFEDILNYIGTEKEESTTNENKFLNLNKSLNENLLIKSNNSLKTYFSSDLYQNFLNIYNFQNLKNYYDKFDTVFLNNLIVKSTYQYYYNICITKKIYFENENDSVYRKFLSYLNNSGLNSLDEFKNIYFQKIIKYGNVLTNFYRTIEEPNKTKIKFDDNFYFKYLFNPNNKEYLEIKKHCINTFTEPFKGTLIGTPTFYATKDFLDNLNSIIEDILKNIMYKSKDKFFSEITNVNDIDSSVFELLVHNLEKFDQKVLNEKDKNYFSAPLGAKINYIDGNLRYNPLELIRIPLSIFLASINSDLLIIGIDDQNNQRETIDIHKSRTNNKIQSFLNSFNNHLKEIFKMIEGRKTCSVEFFIEKANNNQYNADANILLNLWNSGGIGLKELRTRLDFNSRIPNDLKENNVNSITPIGSNQHEQNVTPSSTNTE